MRQGATTVASVAIAVALGGSILVTGCSNPPESATPVTEEPAAEEPSVDTSDAGTAILAPGHDSPSDPIWVPTRLTYRVESTGDVQGGECVTTYRYSTTGDLVEVTQRDSSDSNVRTYDYDCHGYLMHADSGDANLIRDCLPELDDAGRLAKSLSADGLIATTYEYDDEGRLVRCETMTKSESTDEMGGTASEFDKQGHVVASYRLSSDSGQEGGWVRSSGYKCEYDADGRLVKRTPTPEGEDAGIQPIVETRTYEYDANGNLVRVRIEPENDGEQQRSVQTMEYEYREIANPSDGAKLYLYGIYEDAMGASMYASPAH